MATCLVIVESAAKAATIQKYLSSLYPDRKWTVAASFGHIRDLPQKTLGVDTNTWQVTYENLERKKDVIAKLKKISKTADKVYFAADPDLEGYAIAHHLRVTLKLADSKCIRTTFNEITKSALKAAFDTPTGWNDSKVEAQETRRILDRIVGYKVSPLLWKAFRGESGLSAGRVQSAALNMLTKRYANFLDHTPAMSWTTHATFATPNTVIAIATLDTKEASAVSIETIEVAEKHIKTVVTVGRGTYHFIRFSERTRASHPPAPLDTSTLQRESYNHLHKSPKSTMALAQALYEGGFITYMRTDATTLSKDAVAALAEYIITNIGAEYLATATKDQAKEGAHEAIRPTDVGRRGDAVVTDGGLTTDHAALYEVIWKHTVASQMADALYNDISYTVNVDKYVFKGKTSLMTFTGYMHVFGATLDADTAALWRTIMQTTEVKLQSVSAICNVTRPHLLYTETDLVKAMEKNGIGRPSTYVSIIDKLQSKAYVAKGTGPTNTVKLASLIWDDLVATSPRLVETECVLGGTSKDRLVPTDLGVNIQKYLLDNTPQLLDTTFTATMETNLDLIESGTRNKQDVLNEFYVPFQHVLERANGSGTAAIGGSNKHEAAFKKWCGSNTRGDEDLQGLQRLPLKVTGGYTVLLGPYGIYTKYKGKNKKLDPSLWQKVIDGSIIKADIGE